MTTVVYVALLRICPTSDCLAQTSEPKVVPSDLKMPTTTQVRSLSENSSPTASALTPTSPPKVPATPSPSTASSRPRLSTPASENHRPPGKSFSSWTRPAISGSTTPRTCTNRRLASVPGTACPAMQYVS